MKLVYHSRPFEPCKAIVVVIPSPALSKSLAQIGSADYSNATTILNRSERLVLMMILLRVVARLHTCTSRAARS